MTNKEYQLQEAIFKGNFSLAQKIIGEEGSVLSYRDCFGCNPAHHCAIYAPR